MEMSTPVAQYPSRRWVIQVGSSKGWTGPVTWARTWWIIRPSSSSRLRFVAADAISAATGSAAWWMRSSHRSAEIRSRQVAHTAHGWFAETRNGGIRISPATGSKTHGWIGVAEVASLPRRHIDVVDWHGRVVTVLDLARRVYPDLRTQ